MGSWEGPWEAWEGAWRGLEGPWEGPGEGPGGPWIAPGRALGRPWRALDSLWEASGRCLGGSWRVLGGSWGSSWVPGMARVASQGWPGWPDLRPAGQTARSSSQTLPKPLMLLPKRRILEILAWKARSESLSLAPLTSDSGIREVRFDEICCRFWDILEIPSKVSCETR